MPHGWEYGHLFESLFCGDLFTQVGDEHEPLTEADILGPSLAMQEVFDYYSHTKNARPLFDKLIDTRPRVLACMHGAAWQGDGGALLAALADQLV